MMEHAVKHAIAVRMNDNPVFYTSLLEKLQKILDETKNDWIKRKKELEAFIEREVKEGTKAESQNLGLDEKEFAFFKVVKKYLLEEETQTDQVCETVEDYISQEMIDLSKEIAKGTRQVVEENYMIDWVNNPTKASEIERHIYMMLIKGYGTKIKLPVIQKMKQPLLNLAKTHFKVLE